MANTLILLFYMLCLSVGAAVTLAEYMLYGIGLYGMARETGLDHQWLAFVPYGRKYLQGKLGGPITLKGKTLKEPGIWMILLPFIVGIIIGILSGLAAVLAVAGILAGSNTVIVIPLTLVMFLAALIIFLVAVVGIAAKSGLRALVNYQILSRYCQGNILILHIVFSTLLPLYEAAVFFYYRRRPFLDASLHTDERSGKEDRKWNNC